MEAEAHELAGVRVHAVPQTLAASEFRDELARAAGTIDSDATNVLLAHVALTSLPAREWKDINELEVEEAAFDARFDHVLLGHWHVHQKASKRTWYAGSTDSFWFSDRPRGAGAKGLVVLDTDAGTVEHHANPRERPLETVQIGAVGLGPSELLDACGKAGEAMPDGAIVRLFLNGVDAAAFRQVPQDEFQAIIPNALHVQVEPEFAEGALAVQGGTTIGTLVHEWTGFVEMQDLTGLDRERVARTGATYLDEAQAEAI